MTNILKMFTKDEADIIKDFNKKYIKYDMYNMAFNKEYADKLIIIQELINYLKNILGFKITEYFDYNLAKEIYTERKIHEIYEKTNMSNFLTRLELTNKDISELSICIYHDKIAAVFDTYEGTGSDDDGWAGSAEVFNIKYDKLNNNTARSIALIVKNMIGLRKLS